MPFMPKKRGTYLPKLQENVDIARWYAACPCPAMFGPNVGTLQQSNMVVGQGKSCFSRKHEL
jgi:hypothetical protein